MKAAKGRTSVSSELSRGRRRGTPCARRRVLAHFDVGARTRLEPEEVTLTNGLVDYYMLLQVPQNAKHAEIKSAYRAMQKLCHPDILGPEAGSDMSILINQAYTVLADEGTRELYNLDLQESRMEEDLGFVNKALSEWMPATQPARARNWNGAESRALFVDERTCIGCKNCAWQAPDTFIIEDEHGRARVERQWADTESDMQIAVDCCPVDCIHWVGREELPVLEHVMKGMGRIGTGTMRSYQHNTLDVFAMAETFKAKKAEARGARRGWTEAYMYSKDQQAAMDKARAASEAAGAPLTAALRRAWEWVVAGFGGNVPDRRAAREAKSTAKSTEPVANLRAGNATPDSCDEDDRTSGYASA